MPKIKTYTTDWKVLGMSGKTADGRVIPESWITEAAQNYDPDTYSAVINVEHMKFRFPDDELSGLGKVIALKAEQQGDKVALLGQLEVTETLQNYWDKHQKIFSSMEIQENFADTGKAYLTGLAVTDFPASLGTSAHFSIASSQKKESTHLTEYSEIIDMPKSQQPATAEQVESVVSRIKALFTSKEETTKPENKAEVHHQFNVDEFTQALEFMASTVKTQNDTIKQQADELAELKQQFSELKTRLETEIVSGDRDLHNGIGDDANFEIEF